MYQRVGRNRNVPRNTPLALPDGRARSLRHTRRRYGIDTSGPLQLQRAAHCRSPCGGLRFYCTVFLIPVGSQKEFVALSDGEGMLSATAFSVFGSYAACIPHPSLDRALLDIFFEVGQFPFWGVRKGWERTGFRGAKVASSSDPSGAQLRPRKGQPAFAIKICPFLVGVGIDGTICIWYWSEEQRGCRRARRPYQNG